MNFFFLKKGGTSNDPTSLEFLLSLLFNSTKIPKLKWKFLILKQWLESNQLLHLWNWVANSHYQICTKDLEITTNIRRLFKRFLQNSSICRDLKFLDNNRSLTFKCKVHHFITFPFCRFDLLSFTLEVFLCMIACHSFCYPSLWQLEFGILLFLSWLSPLNFGIHC